MAFFQFRSLRPQYHSHIPLRPWIPQLILFLGLLVTGVIIFYLERMAFTKETLLFSSRVEETQSVLQTRLETYITLLRASAGFFSSTSAASEDTFHTFTLPLHLETQYPGIQGIGFIRRVPAAEQTAYLEHERLRNGPNFSVYPATQHDESYPVQFIEPLDRANKKIVGFDTFSDPIRQEAIQRARDTGNAAATGKLQLLRDYQTASATGFLIYYPVYTSASQPAELAARQSTIRGLIYSPFHSNELFEGIFHDYHAPGIDLHIYDGMYASTSALLYEPKDHVLPTFGTRHSSTKSLVVAGRPWTLVYQTNADFPSSLERHLIPIVFFVGSGMSIFVFLLSGSQYRARLAAEAATNTLLASQDALKRSEEMYRLVVENSSDLITISSVEGMFIYASPSYKRLLGYSPKELIGTPGFALVHPDDLKAAQREMQKAFKQKIVHTRLRMKHKRGHYVIFEGNGTLLFDTDRKSPMMVTSARDITQQLQLEKRKDDFISIASHELKTPVTSLKAFSQVLHRRFVKNNDEASAKLLEKMNTQLDKLTNLITDLLDISRIESGKIIFTKGSFDINELAKEIVEEVQRTTDEVHIQIQGNVSKLVSGDRDRTGQVLMNLLTNALKYAPHAKEVILSLSAAKGFAHIQVTDFGIGIPEDKLRRVFSRFYRVEGPGNESSAGLGLGLYISSTIVKRQGGKIWVESTVGKGSQFHFTIPLKK